MSKEKHPNENQKKVENRESESSEVTLGEAGGQEEAAISKPETEVELIKGKLAKSEEQAKEQKDQLLRLAAEFDNYRKRTAKEFANLVKSANERLIFELLNTLDNFQRALDSAKTSNDFKNFHKGVELIYTHMKDILTKEGLKEIQAIGKPFDPNYHEAVTQAQSDKYEEGIVMEEISKGYMLNDRLLRASKVVVSKGKSKEEKEE